MSHPLTQLTLAADTAPQMRFMSRLLSTMADVLEGTFDPATSAASAEEVIAALTSANPTLVGTAPTADVIDMPKRRGRKKADAAETAPTPPAQDFVVYRGDGSVRAGYAHADAAARVLVDELGNCEDADDIDNVLTANAETLERMESEVSKTVIDAAQARRASFKAPTPPADTDKPVTFEEVRDALKTVMDTLGFAVAQERLAKLGVRKVSEIAEADRARALAIINGEG